jgi:hypothetical protein
LIYRLVSCSDGLKRQLDGVRCEISGVLGIVTHEFVDERGVGNWLRKRELIQDVP